MVTLFGVRTCIEGGFPKRLDADPSRHQHVRCALAADTEWDAKEGVSMDSHEKYANVHSQELVSEGAELMTRLVIVVDI